MNIKIIGMVLLVVLIIAGIAVILQYYEHQEEKLNKNITKKLLENPKVIDLNTSENKTPTENITKNISKENKNLVVYKSENVSIPYPFNTIMNKKYIYENYKGNNGDDSSKSSVLKTVVYVKGVENINGRKYLVINSSTAPSEDSLTVHKTKNQNDIPFYYFFRNCSDHCEKLTCGGLFDETTIYIDLETKYIKIISVPWGIRYKKENGTIYEKSELCNNEPIVKEYNLTSYEKYDNMLRGIFSDAIYYHFLYLPGFIDFNYTNISGTKELKLMSAKCSNEKVKVCTENPFFGERCNQVYNCSLEYKVIYKRKTNNKVIMEKEDIEKTHVYSSMNNYSLGNVGSVSINQGATEKLVWTGTENIGGREADVIEYTISNGKYMNEKWKVLIDKKDKILLGVEEWNCFYMPGEKGRCDEIIKYKLLKEEYVFCGDGICNSDNQENSETCCEDCGCANGEECRGHLCMKKINDSYLYVDNFFNYSIKISADFYGKKSSNNKILFYNKNENKKSTLNIQIIPDTTIGGVYKSVEDIKTHILEQIENYENFTEEKVKISNNYWTEMTILYHYGNDKIKQNIFIIKRGDYFYMFTCTSPENEFDKTYDECEKMLEGYNEL